MIIAGRTPVNKHIVDKHDPVRNKTVVSNRDAIADERVGLNSAAAADTYTLLYFHERPNEGFVADGATIKINRLDKNNPLAKFNIDDADRSNFRVHHKNVTRRPGSNQRQDGRRLCAAGIAIADQKPLLVNSAGRRSWKSPSFRQHRLVRS